jgi:hypothetical protein
VGAPVDVLPVADESENEQHDRDEEQAGGFEGVDVVLGRAGLPLRVWGGHADIVALSAFVEAIRGAGHVSRRMVNYGISVCLRRNPVPAGE